MPTLTLLAGPNGAGKTRYSEYLRKQGILKVNPLTVDFLVSAINEHYKSMLDYDLMSEERYQVILSENFEKFCNKAISENKDFAFETNYRHPYTYIREIFVNANYDIDMIYIILDSIDQSQERVNYRVQQEKGNYVDKFSIQYNFKNGLENLDNTFKEFKNLYIIDNSFDNYENKRNSRNLNIVFKASIQTTREPAKI